MFKKVEKGIRQGIKKTVVKVKLDANRDAARQALEESNQGLTEINQIIVTYHAKLDNLSETLYLLLNDITTKKALKKLAAAQLKITALNVRFDNFLNTQKLIIIQHNIALTERGNVSQIPNIMASSTHAEIQGKEACYKAQEAAQTIKQALSSTRTELTSFQSTLQECTVLFEEAKTLQLKESEKTQAVLTATRAGNLIKLKELIQQEKADINEAIFKKTALHLASLLETPNSEELVTYLLTNGADPNARDSNNWTPIHYAIYTKNQSTLDLYAANQLLTEEHQQFINHPTQLLLQQAIPEKKETSKIDYEKVSRFFSKEYQELFKKSQRLEEENDRLKKLVAEQQQQTPAPLLHLQPLLASRDTPEPTNQTDNQASLKK